MPYLKFKQQQQDSNPQSLSLKIRNKVHILSLSDIHGILTHNYLVHKGPLAKWLSGCLQTGCGFESHYCHLNLRYGTCFNHGVSLHSGKL